MYEYRRALPRHKPGQVAPCTWSGGHLGRHLFMRRGVYNIHIFASTTVWHAAPNGALSLLALTLTSLEAETLPVAGNLLGLDFNQS